MENIDIELKKKVFNSIKNSAPTPIKSKKIELYHSIRYDLAIDSLGMVSLATYLETEFPVNIRENLESFAKVNTVEELIEFVYDIHR